MYDPIQGRWMTRDPLGLGVSNDDADLLESGVQVAANGFVSFGKTLGDPDPYNHYRLVGNNPLNRRDPSGLAALPVATLEEAQSIANKGVPKEEGVMDMAGPDVTSWYAQDLIAQLDFRLKTMAAPIRDAIRFRDQGRDAMSYKWIDFGSPEKGRGVNTVVLGKVAIAKKQLGNIALTFVGTIFPPYNKDLDAAALKRAVESTSQDPSCFATAIHIGNLMNDGKINSSSEKVAAMGYSIVPAYDGSQFGDFDRVYRADNLAAFGVGQMLAWRFMKELDPNDDKARDIIKDKVKSDEGSAELATKLEKVLREFFADTEQSRKDLLPAVNAFRWYQPGKNPPEIGVDALFFTPDYKGFNLNSLSKEGVSIFQPKGGNTILWEKEMNKQWEKDNPGKSHAEYEKWRQEQFEKWDKYGGFKPSDIMYPK